MDHSLNQMLAKLKRIHEQDQEQIRLLEEELKEARQNFRFWFAVVAILLALWAWNQAGREARQVERGHYGGENVERY